MLQAQNWRPSVGWISSRGSRDGVFTICVGPALVAWPGWGFAPHVADKILNHQAGTISGVAAVYQRHDFLAESRAALDIPKFMARSVT
jgi:hypothetical protein